MPTASDEAKPRLPLEFMHDIARKGGSVTGEKKRRGDSEHYRQLALKAVEARKRNAALAKGINEISKSSS